MEQRISDIRSDIEHTKSNIATTLDSLETRAQDFKDWQSMVKTYPLISIVGAIGIGFVFSGGLRQLIQPSRPILKQLLWSSVSTALLKNASISPAKPNWSRR